MRLVFCALFLALMLLGCLQDESSSFKALEQASAARAVDGDTILLENGERVRLIGIDAPEKGEKCFEEAKNRLQDLVFGKRLLLQKDRSERDRYGRLVRFVYADSVFVNLAMVEEGLAFAFEFEPDTSFKQAFRKAEQRAFDSKGCLWG
jgi:micrococcal nuclease